MTIEQLEICKYDRIEFGSKNPYRPYPAIRNVA